VLVSRRTAPRAAHGLPAERLRDDGCLEAVQTRNDASVLQAASADRGRAGVEATATNTDPRQLQRYFLKHASSAPPPRVQR
jgi:hypothetical protein